MDRRIFWSSVLCLLFATMAWGGLFHVGKWALNSLDPYWFTAIRYIGAAIFIAIILVAFKTIDWRGFRQHWKKLTTYGLLGYAVFGILVFVGLSMSVPSHGAVIMATMPITSHVIGWLYDKKPVELSGVIIALIALFGVGLVSGAWGQVSGNAEVTFKGDLIALIGTLGWIFYSRGQKGFTDISVFEYTAFTTFLACPIIVLFAIILSSLGIAEIPTVDAVNSALPAMFYVVVFATVLSGLAFNYGVKNLGAHQGIVFINFVPISAWVIGMAQGQMPSGNELIGTALVIVSLLAQAFSVNLSTRRLTAVTTQ